MTLIKTIDPATVEWSDLVAVTRSVGNYLRYPVVIILLCLAVILYKSNIILKFRKVHNMKSLRNQEQYNWPAIMR